MSVRTTVVAYCEAVNDLDLDRLLSLFAPDAVVRDEQKDHIGHVAIERWIAQTSQAAQPHVSVTSARTLGATVKLTGRVAGNFAGSPVDLDYEFHLQGGKIARLTIQ